VLLPTGNIYFTDTESHTVRMIDVVHGTLKLIGGPASEGTARGAPLKCRMSRPTGSSWTRTVQSLLATAKPIGPSKFERRSNWSPLSR